MNVMHLMIARVNTEKSNKIIVLCIIYLLLKVCGKYFIINVKYNY